VDVSAGDRGGGDPAIDRDGDHVAFIVSSDELGAHSGVPITHVYLWSRKTGSSVQVDAGTAGQSGNELAYGPSVDASGRRVAFTTGADNLVGGDTNLASDVFVRDVLWHTTARASLTASGEQGNGPSVDAAISLDGHEIAFSSDATNLVGGDTNVLSDVFLRRLQPLEGP
jgi:Tol biopolymer transport system component